MKRNLLWLVFLLNAFLAFGQQGKHPMDEFTYTTIGVSKVEKDSVSLSGGNSLDLGSFSLESTDNMMSLSGEGIMSDIGETSGELGVSLTGGATYNVPIAVPPGINGIQPQVSLSYNSQGGNGLAGYGWNISGISIITRIPSTKFHDGNIDAVDFNSLDRFSFDGQRLVLKSGTYGAAGAQYETENSSNLKIISYGTSPYGAAYGPSYFIVYYPDGSTARYGSTANSRSRTDYAITYWENPQGVRISYEYVIQDNSLSISKIKYGSRTTSTPVNEIQFIYGTRKRSEQSYIGSISFMRKTLLKEIRVLGNGSGYRNYILNHTFSNLGYDRLTSIQEKSGDNSLSHSPISFNYTTSTSSVNYTGVTMNSGFMNIEQRNSDVVSLDLSGDGKMDFIVHPKSSSQRNKFWVLKDLEAGSFNYPVEVNSGSFEALFPVSWLSHNNKILSGQGIGLVQNTTNNQVKFKVYSNGTANPIYYQYEKLWNAPTYTSQLTCGSSETRKIPQKYISGDFDGDGLSDVLAIGLPYQSTQCMQYLPNPGEPCGLQPMPISENQLQSQDSADTLVVSQSDTLVGPQLESSTTSEQNALIIEPIDPNCCQCSSYTSGSSRVHLIKLDRRITSGFATSAGYMSLAVQSNHQLYTADVNGDGKTDLLQVIAGKIYVHSFDNNNVLKLLWTTTDTRIKLDMPLLFGDYNGDGKTDFMTPTSSGSSVFAVFLSSGVQFVKSELSYPFQFNQTNWNGSNGTLSGYNLVPVDINGDGRTDILDYRTTTYNSSTNGTQVVSVYHNTFSTSTAVTPAFSFGGSASKYGELKHFPIPVFLAADMPNLNLDFASISDSYISSFRFTMDHREDVLMRSVSSNGVSHAIQYNNLNVNEYGLDYTSVYQTSYQQTYPFVDIQVAPGFKVVSSLQRTYSNTPTLKQVFSYYGAVTNIEGLGFLGFQGVARSNWHTSSSDRMFDVSLYDSNLRGAVTTQYLSQYYNFNSIPTTYISKTVNTYAPPSLAANKAFTLKLNSQVASNSLEGTTTTTNYLYDSYNNPTQIKSFYSGDGTKTVNFTYFNSTGTTYYIGRPSTKIETMAVGSSTFSTEEQYFYSGSLVTQKKYKGNSTQFTTEDYQYDIFGNILKKIITPYGTTPREVNFEYDLSGRFLTKTTDVQGLSTIFTYNPSSGRLVTEKNPYNQTTSYFYDSWNRLIKATDYLGKNVLTSFSEASYSYTVTVSGDDGSSQIKVYDPLKRLKLIKEKNVLGQWVQKNYEYDKFDRLWKESEPFIGTSPSQWNITEYDFYGRPVKHTAYTGKTTNFSYTDLSVTVSDGTKTVTTTKDALGNVISVTDPGGTVFYSYFGNGQMKSANYDNIVVSVEQDGWGRKKKLIDPSAGTYTYEYNGFGELTKETTPKGVTTYTYSPLGELQQKKVTGDLTDMTQNYTYDSTSKLITSLVLSNADGNNTNCTYTYDSYKRPLSVIETNPYASFTKRFTYDGFGRIYTEENQANAYGKSSVKKVKNTYQNGGLINVSDFTTSEVLWTLDAMNARGQVTLSTVGNNLKRINTYNTYGYLTQSKAEKSSGTTTTQLMQLSYNFNAQRGTLTSRTNSLFAWNESFTYDSQDRLLAFNDNNSQNSHTYDARGRIVSNSKLGNYIYSTTSYQQTELSLNPSGQAYFSNYQKQQITYNSFKNPVEITEEGKDKVSFEYNAFMGRSNMFYGGLDTNKTLRKHRKHYSHDGSMEVAYEKTTGKVTFVTYLMGDAYNSPVIWHSEHSGSIIANNYYYLHRDYLGSILAITDKEGVFKEKRHFDAWGNIVKLQDGAGNNLTAFKILDRGYTGHEHLLGVGIIHMNGRLYDPVLHRFLSPDNFVQDPFNTQNFNRYAYVLNNPLMYTDPSGEIIPFLIIGAAIVGAYIGGAQANGSYNPAKWDWSSGSTWGGIIGGGILGAASMGAGIAASAAIAPAAMAMVGVSGGAIGGAISGFIGGVVGGAISGGGMAILPGGDGKFLAGMYKGAIVGGLTGAVLGGVIGGITTPKSHSWVTGNPHRTPVTNVSEITSMGINENSPLSKGEFYKGKIVSEVNGDFQLAMKEWNNIQRQYGMEVSQKFPNSFKTTMGDGSTVTGQFYSGGTTNPQGFSIKINTYLDQSIIPITKKIPAVYIRY
jgi:RHS repeat-associated protein